MSRFADYNIKKITPYVPGEQPRAQKYIKLNTNENPYPPSPKAIAAAISETYKYNLYPDPECSELTEKLAEEFSVGIENIFLGNGSDEVLAFIFLGFCEGGVAFPDITYGFYKVYSEIYNRAAEIIPLKDDLSIDYNDYLNIDKAVVIANPNAPTGMVLKIEDIEKILQCNRNNLIVIDEAYVDFGSVSSVCLIEKYDNLVVVGTFSKSRSLAGARIGYAVSSKDVIDDLKKIKFSFNPYSLNRATLAAASASISDRLYFEKCISKIISTREKFKLKLKEMGYLQTDSKANFVFIKHPYLSGADVYERLRDNGILIRHFGKERISDYLRITIGSEEDMEVVTRELSKLVDDRGSL
jgi:histidinol-phosphate aminotransferase